MHDPSDSLLWVQPQIRCRLPAQRLVGPSIEADAAQLRSQCGTRVGLWINARHHPAARAFFRFLAGSGARSQIVIHRLMECGFERIDAIAMKTRHIVDTGNTANEHTVRRLVIDAGKVSLQ